MGFWSFYFFAKIGAFCAGFIGLHLWQNLAFALFVALPTGGRRWLRIAKQIVAVPVGIALAYYDSWLPPWRRIVAQWDQLSSFSSSYLLELIGRFINPQFVLALFLGLLLYWLLSRKLRLSSFAILALLLAPWLGRLTGAVAPAAPVVAAAGPQAVASSTQDLNAVLDAFHAREQQRKLHIVKPADDNTPFDIILLQICSLAWDDLAYVNAREHQLLSHFDVRFDNFSSAASYSGPAAIRLLRSTCGQSPHEKLYAPAPPECTLMDQLEAAGFTRQWAMNHDGVYGDMRSDIIDRGHVGATLFPLGGLQPMLRAFSGDPYFRDYDVLSAWWKKRLASNAPRVALYYNTGTLHDGNHFLDGSKPNTQESYRRRVQTLFGDIEHFIADINASGRRAVVVMVPEHGANVRGDRLQISGLRELPSPAIALIPVGVRLVGRPQEPTIAVPQPTSLFGLSSLLAGFIASNPYAATAPALSDYVRAVPETEFVAENGETVVMRANGRYWMRGADHKWAEYLP